MQSLAAVVERSSISPLHPPFLPSLPLPPDSNDAGKIVVWSQHPTSATRESTRQADWEEAEEKKIYIIKRGLLKLRAESVGAEQSSEVKEWDGGVRGMNRKERERGSL